MLENTHKQKQKPPTILAFIYLRQAQRFLQPFGQVYLVRLRSTPLKTQVQLPSCTGAELSSASALPVTLWRHLRVTLPHPCQTLCDFRLGRLEGGDCTAEEFNSFGVMRSKKWPTLCDKNLLWDGSEACYTLHNMSFRENSVSSWCTRILE